ncbi:MAG TPA: class I SAM-dependent methyltransferase [Terriglobales bacterium]|nr:class I SAM-dependent methyltransferase [Terriglobales bacterium]
MPIIIGKFVIGNRSATPRRRLTESQCKRPRGLLGRFVLWNMNSRHSRVTDWGLSHVAIRPSDVVLDVGCGGGRTVAKLAAIAAQGKVCGVDFSPASVAMARNLNTQGIAAGRVDIREASVSQLPFADGTFDVVTAVETHFWWPDLKNDMREVFRVVKPAGAIAVIAEIYRGANTATAQLAEKYIPLSGMALLSADEHRELLHHAGFTDVQIFTQKSWICATGKKRLPT